MIRLQLEWDDPGIADGLYTVHAAGALIAGLWWANGAGPLPGWTAFAFLPVAPSGRGVFRFTGGRAVPREATHIFVRAVSPDMKEEEALFPPAGPAARAAHGWGSPAGLHHRFAPE